MPNIHRLLNALAWRLDRASDLLRGESGRHRAMARLAAARKARTWRPPRGKPLLVIGLAEHLGDLVAAEPLARWLRERHPGAHLAWAVRPAYRELIDALPFVDETLPVRCLTEWVALRDRGALGGLYDGERGFVDLHLTGRLCPVCGLRQRHPVDSGVDASNYYRHGSLLQIFAKTAGLAEPFADAVAAGFDDAPRVHPTPADAAAVDSLNLPARFVAVHGRSNQDVRDWRDEKWRHLAGLLAADCVPVVEVGVAAVLPGVRGVTNLCGRLSILQTAEVLRRSAAFVGIDSGPAHLANAAGAPGVILLGRYRGYDRYLPYSGRYADISHADVIHCDGPAAEIPVGHVHDLLRRRLARGVQHLAAPLAGRVGSSPQAGRLNLRVTEQIGVSVIIPTYGHRDFVLDAIRSVLSQHHPRVEIIVVNDGSPDDTADVLRPLVESNDIRYVEQPNAGQAAARNTGIALARGRFVAMLDDDDLWPPGTLAALTAALDENPAAVLAYGDVRRTDAAGVPTGDDPPRDHPAGDVYDAFRHQCWLVSPGQALVRADALKTVGGFDPAVWGSDDWDLYLRLARLGSFAFVGRPTLLYRQHAANASRDVLRHAAGHLRVVRRHFRRARDVPLLLRHQRAASAYFLGKLTRHAAAADASGDGPTAARSLLYAASFKPSLALGRSWWVMLGRAGFRTLRRNPTTKQAGV